MQSYSSLVRKLLVNIFKCTTCHWTIFHTPPYLVEDAEWLLIRLKDPTNPAGHPTLLRPAPPPSPLPQPPAINPTQNPPATQALNSNRIYCSNSTCVTKSGTRTPGNNECIAKLCLGCCKLSTAQARDSGIERTKCQAHKQPQVLQRVIPQPQAVPQEHSPPPPSQPSIWLPSAVETPQPPPEPTQPRRRPLAQPIAPAWANQQAAAEQEKISIKSLKIQQHEMDERRKRTCLLIVYHMVCDFCYIYILTKFIVSRAVNLLYELTNTSRLFHIFVSQHAHNSSMTSNSQQPAVLTFGKGNGSQ